MMTELAKPHVGDTGTVLRKTITTDGSTVINVSAATTKEVRFYGPGGVTSTIAASFVTDGSDGQIEVSTLVGTWSVAGDWIEQVHITLPTGDWAGNAEKRKVYNRIF